MDRKLPVGIQGFEKLRTDNFLYVDKTEYIYNLVHNNVPYFLSRPRRFGKSLLLSAMKAYWEGKRELFSGLDIERLEEGNANAWKKYPVFYFDFNGANYNEEGALDKKISFLLQGWEKEYDSVNENNTLAERFQKLLIKAKEKTGLRCVVLVDEYDKPLLDVVDDTNMQEYNKALFKGFFSTLKSFDDYIQFIFITGVSKFHKVSIFSDLNQLRDISLDEDYAELCGITGDEIKRYFSPELETLSKRQEIKSDECLNVLKRQYDGYHFHPRGLGVFNPYSLLTAFSTKEFGSYWFETGTPTYLVKRVKNSSFDLRKFTDHTIYASEAILKDYTGDSLDLIPLLYQTGYLTIEEYDKTKKRYTLSFPNDEVKYGFLESLMPSYIPKATAGSGLDIFSLDEYVENGDLDKIKDVLVSLFANITYTIQEDPFEHYFQAVIYLVFTLLGKLTLCEMHTYTGRIDCKLETKDYIYLFEFKRDDTAEAALKQIDDKDYALPFSADSRKLYKIGVAFDSASRMLTGWEVAE
ncbi:ATP-binding protein [Butyrivibrio sp. YAB3001]|uniref:ATP-binding protein n=1 Tax=Butyrivibrio sp. YAB3001 TaxID=1520812 RepID=UPI0008F61F56|nr:ATP-binding protein [Butyrivibrio sp. YAB3001]SFC65421.1 PD-(D/E)XK nuclease superfamily protein [Butyrivibrio sp. YAB3001]